MTDKEKALPIEEGNKKKISLARFIKSPDTIFEIIVTAAFLGLSLWVLLYYITGPALGYFHSDCADSLIWAQAMIDSGEVLSEDFAYAAILPFGAPLWMVPILKFFGFTMKAQTISMCIFTVIFVLSALSLFRAMKWKYSLSAGATFCLSMILSGSVKLREIMWEHVIYYSLGILFLMLLLNLAFRFFDKLSELSSASIADKVKMAIYGVLLCLLCAGCATDGFQVIALSIIPVAAAIVAYTIFDKDVKLNSDEAIKRYLVCAVMAVGAIGGILLLNLFTHGGEISSGYGNAYSTWSPMNEWWLNAEKFFEQYLTLVGIEADPSEVLFSGKSILMLIKLVGSFIVLVCPFILIFGYKNLKDKYSKMVAWAHLVVTAVVLVGFVFGRLSNVNWRLTPFLGSSIIATLVYVKHLIGDSIVCRRIGALLAAILICFSMINAKEMLDMPHDFGKDDPLQKVADTLVEKGYTRGYATFWNASETTLRADSAVEVITVTVETNGYVNTRAYQTMDYWFDDVEGQKNYFLLLDEYEYDTVLDSTYWSKLNQKCSLIDQFYCEGYYILVFDGNVFVS